MSPANYTPDDSRVTLPALEFLRTDEGKVLLSALAGLGDPAAPTVAEVASLRKRFPREMLHAGLVLAAAQAKGRRKFPDIPFVWATPEALEQATSRAVAVHKARRFAAAKAGAIFDLCCGIGGDALALAEVAPVTAVDLSAVRTACLRFNAMDQGIAPRFPLDVRVGDVEKMIDAISAGALVHIDPARRVTTDRGTKRSPQFADSIPGPELMERIFARVGAGGAAGGGAIKLSPAADFEELPDGHLELISHNGSVVQAVLWRGVLAGAPGERSATVLEDGAAPFTFTAAPEAPRPGQIPLLDSLSANSAAAIVEPGHPLTLYELDGAFTRAGLAAGLAARLGLAPLTLDGGYCVSPSAPMAHPGLAGFLIRGITRFSEARVAEMLRQLPPAAPGPVEVKCRGRLSGVETDHLQGVWSKAAPGLRTVLLFSHEKDVIAVAADRVYEAATLS